MHINQIGICLIPKVSHPKLINKLRTISLCNNLYEIISNVVISILKIIIPQIVPPLQTNFVQGEVFMIILYWHKK